MENRSTVKKGLARIILLFVGAFCFLAVAVIILHTGKQAGMTDLVIRQGKAFFRLPLALAVLFLIAAYYELTQYRRDRIPKTGRTVLTVVLMAAVALYWGWNAIQMMGNQTAPVDMENYQGEVAAPLLDTVCPEEYECLMTALRKNAEQPGIHRGDRYVVYRKNGRAEVVATQEYMPGDYNEETGIVEPLFSYTTTLYAHLTSQEYIDGLVKDWNQRMAVTNDEYEAGMVDGCCYQYLKRDEQYLVLWDNNTVLTAQYRGAASLLDSLPSYANALSWDGETD